MLLKIPSQCTLYYVIRGIIHNGLFTLWKRQQYPSNTGTAVLFYNHFKTFDFSCISVVDFGQLKYNWNSIGKDLQTTVKKPYISYWNSTILKRFLNVFIQLLCYQGKMYHTIPIIGMKPGSVLDPLLIVWYTNDLINCSSKLIVFFFQPWWFTAPWRLSKCWTL